MRRRCVISFALALALRPASESLAQQGLPAPGADAGAAVLRVLAELFGAAQAGDMLLERRNLVEPSLREVLRPGYARLLSSEAQVAFHLGATTLVLGADLAEVRTSWERRALVRPRLQPVRRAGSITMQFGRYAQAWRLRGLRGDNPFGIAARR
jgi:hypothetical protein